MKNVPHLELTNVQSLAAPLLQLSLTDTCSLLFLAMMVSQRDSRFQLHDLKILIPTSGPPPAA